MEDEFKHLVRISRKDVDGNKTIEHALTEIKGVGLSLSKTICRVLDLDLNSKIGYIADEDVAKIEEVLEDVKAGNVQLLDTVKIFIYFKPLSLLCQTFFTFTCRFAKYTFIGY